MHRVASLESSWLTYFFLCGFCNDCCSSSRNEVVWLSLSCLAMRGGWPQITNHRVAFNFTLSAVSICGGSLLCASTTHATYIHRSLCHLHNSLTKKKLTSNTVVVIDVVNVTCCLSTRSQLWVFNTDQKQHFMQPTCSFFN